MKKTTLLSILLASASVTQIASADTLAKWTFEANTPADLNNSTTISSLLADEGTGTASGVHANAATDWTTPVGNGSANSLSANEWTVGDYFQFSVSTLGFDSLSVGWGQTSSSTGPGQFKFAYQVNGGGFTDYIAYTVLPNQAGAPGLGSWGSGTEILGYNFSLDLSAVTLLQNATSVDFRLILASTADSTPPGTIASGGTSRVDNFTVTAMPIAVPEPSAMAIVGGFGMLALFMAARRRN